MLSLCAGMIVSNTSSEGLSELERDFLNPGVHEPAFGAVKEYLGLI